MAEIEHRLETLLEHDRATERELDSANRRLAFDRFNVLLGGMMQVRDATVLAARVEEQNIERLREMSDWFRDRVQSGVAVLGMVQDGKPVIIATVTDDLIARGVRAGDLVREVAKIVGGSGGGRPNMAQAGGGNPERLSDALNAVAGLVEAALK